MRSEITAKQGLLWRNGKVIDLPEADIVAAQHGYLCAERMVRALEKKARERAAFIFGEAMRPCPKCDGFQLGYSMPIQMKEPIEPGDDAKKILGKWARSVKDGPTMLEGPVRIVCRECGHRGPHIVCYGRTAEDVGKDAEVAKELKRLWNNQLSLGPGG